MAKERDDPPDGVLVVAAILGDLEAFNELAGRYRAAAVRTAQAIVGRDDAEDVAQEALLLAFKALPSIEQPSKFAAWLGAVTRNRALRFNKRESTQKQGRVELDEVLLAEIDALSRPFLAEREANEELRLALEGVPDDYALVLRMHFLDEMPLKRIAAYLGVPVSTIKWRVHKGKQLLREQVELLGKSEVQSGKRTGNSQAR
ncbi:MAG TPA: RNA polymerase sigma factor [Pyrinomonadaceae bacterium]|jgi:RNA polymerase sigma-70 factor (ECF subfamily)